MTTCPACGREKNNIESGVCEKCLTFPPKKEDNERDLEDNCSRIHVHYCTDIKLDIHKRFIHINNVKFKKIDINKCTFNSELGSSIILYLKNGIKHIFDVKEGDVFGLCELINKAL